MKRPNFIFLLTFLVLIFACKEIGVKNKNQAGETYSSITIDSVIEEDSAKISDSVMVKYSSKLLWFPGLENKRLLEEIYSGKNITDFSKNGLQKFLINEKEKLYNNLKTADLSTVNSRQDWQYVSQMNLKMNKNGYLYIQYYDNRSEEGQKEQYHYQEKVFDLRNNEKLKLSDIVSISKEALSQLLKTNLDKTTMMQQMKKYDEEGYSILASAHIPVTDNFYFDDNNLYFHYNMNEISKKYDIGDIIVPISWQDLSENLKADFKERMKINSY